MSVCNFKNKCLLFSSHSASKGNIIVIKGYVIPTLEKQEYIER